MKKLLILTLLIASCGTSKQIAPIEIDVPLNATETTIEPIPTNKELRHERKEQKQADKTEIKLAKIDKRKTKITVKAETKQAKIQLKSDRDSNSTAVKINKSDNKLAKEIERLNVKLKQAEMKYEQKLAKYKKQVELSENRFKIFKYIMIALGILLLIIILLIILYYSRKILP